MTTPPIPPSDAIVYRLADRAAWDVAEAAGVYEGAEIDFRDGYIHLSTAAQAAETARLYYRGRDQVVLVAVDAAAVASDLKWEASRGGDLFPHLYAPLPLTAVLWARDVPNDADGVPQLDGLL